MNISRNLTVEDVQVLAAQIAEKIIAKASKQRGYTLEELDLQETEVSIRFAGVWRHNALDILHSMEGQVDIKADTEPKVSFTNDSFA